MKHTRKATSVTLDDDQRNKVDILSKELTGSTGLTAYVRFAIERDWNERKNKI